MKVAEAPASFLWAISDLGLQARVPDRFPAGTSATFDILASGYTIGSKPTGRESDYSRDLWDVRVSIRLSEGLSFAPSLQAPAGTHFSPNTGIWDVGYIGNAQDPIFSVPVIITNGSIPLEELCLTATVESVNPAFELDLELQENNDVTVCLGNDPPVVVNEGEIVLWWLHDCVGVTDHPCGAGDALELFARADHGEISLPAIQRRDVFSSTSSNGGVTYLDPESVIVQVSDPRGRIYDSRTPSLTDASTVSWQTASQQSSIAHPGVRVFYSRTGFNDRIADWNNVVRTVSVSGLDDGTPPPGRVRVRHDNSPTNTFYDPAPPSYTHMRTPFNLTSTTNNHNDYILEFTTLGTYVVNFHALATRSDGVTTYPASADYIFHVGPISELAVMDGGKGSPLAAADQTAYTIQAANNGPDRAPAVLVTLAGVPQGAEVITFDGTYRETSCAGGICEAEWDLGRPPILSSRPVRGQTDFPTLTLIAPDGAPTPDIQASIANTEGHSVVIDGVIHSTHYFDYIEENNAATIVALPGMGGGTPGTPQGLQGSFYLQPPAAVVRWDEVDLLNRWPVSHYQVWKFEDEAGTPCQAPRLDQDGAAVEGTLYLDSLYVEDSRTCYYVRAVNTQGVAGYWSEPVTATSEGLDQPRLSLEAGPDVGEGEAATFTVRASPAPVAGDTLVVYYTVADKQVDINPGGYVDAAEEGRQDVPLDNRGRATITVPTQSDDMDRPDGEVTVTLEDGFGYTLGTPKTASVAVLDDDNPTVSFAVSPTEPLSEGNYTHNVTVSLDRPSHAALDIYYTLGGDIGDETVRFRIPGSGRERFVTAPSGATSVDIPVRLLDDTDTLDDTVLNLFLSPRHYYDLGAPASYTLTIIEDDGPRAEFALTESAVDEANATHNVVLNLNPPADGDVPISYSLNGSTATNGDDYSIEGVTGSTGSVSASDGETSVTIPLSIIADADAEGDETVVLTLLSSPDYTLGDDRKHTVTIRDDDLPRASFDAGTSNPGEGKGAHNVRVNLSPPAPPDGLTLRYNVGGTATRNRDYRMPNTVDVPGGANHVNIPVEITDDGDSEPDETVVLTLRAGSGYAVDDPGEHTLTIADDDPPLVAFAAAEASVSERGGTHRATILVEPAPHSDITVSYTAGGTATEGAEDDFTVNGCDGDPCTVTVRRGLGWVDVPVRILNDDDNEGDETVVLTLTGGDGYDLALPVRHELTIRDDDAPVVSFPEPAVTVYEDNIGTHTVRVNLDRPAERAFTLKFSVGSPPPLVGADGATDYSLPDPMEARVEIGRDYVDIPLTVTADTDNEADEIVVLTLEPGRGYSVGSADEYTLTIVDDDNAGYPLVERSRGGNTLTWGEGNGSFNPTWYAHNNFGDVDKDDVAEGLVYFRYVGGTATPGEDFYLFGIGGQTVEKAGDTFWVEPFWPRYVNPPPDPTINWARFGFHVNEDNRSEGSETAIFRLLNGPGYRVKADRQDYTVIILD